MRIVTWNIRRKRGAWEYLIDELRPDIALIQEVPQAVFKYGGIVGKTIGDTRPWGSAIWTNGLPADELTIMKDPGWVVAAQVHLPNGSSLLAVSVHAKLTGD